MNKLKIPENHSGVSKTLRLPENIVDDIQNLANIKNLFYNHKLQILKSQHPYNHPKTNKLTDK